MTPPAIDLFSTPDRIPNVVVVDPQFDSYGPLVESARDGLLDLHFRSRGRDALKLATRRTVDAWLVAADLDDMSGHDLVELLKGEATGSPIAMVIDGEFDGRRRTVAQQAAVEAGADLAVAHPISLVDLERLLGMTTEERAREFESQGVRRPFVTLPVGVGAAVIAVAVLMMG